MQLEDGMTTYDFFKYCRIGKTILLFSFTS